MHGRRLKAVAVAVALFAGSAVAGAQPDVTLNFGSTVVGPTVPGGSWFVHRYAPTVFDLTNATNGRNNVLNIGITDATNAANRLSGAQSVFYDTQGGAAVIAAAPGPYKLRADLWVDNSWATNPAASNNSRRTDMWGVALDNGSFGYEYSILGFTNQDGNGTFRARVVDIATGGGTWVNFSASVLYGAWNSLEISWDSVTKLYSYLVNGSSAGSIAGGAGAVTVGGMIMAAVNFNNPQQPIIDPNYPNGYPSGSTPYTALWTNAQASSVVPEPSTVALCAMGLVGIVAVSRRRRSRAN